MPILNRLFTSAFNAIHKEYHYIAVHNLHPFDFSFHKYLNYF